MMEPTTLEQFAERMHQIRNHAYVFVFKEFDLRVRGIVDDAFIEKGAENRDYWILVSRTAGVFVEGSQPNSQAETLEYVEGHRKRLCAFGLSPPDGHYDKEVMLEALTNLGNSSALA